MYNFQYWICLNINLELLAKFMSPKQVESVVAHCCTNKTESLQTQLLISMATLNYEECSILGYDDTI
jgi:hypothetical protein